MVTVESRPRSCSSSRSSSKKIDGGVYNFYNDCFQDAQWALSILPLEEASELRIPVICICIQFNSLFPENSAWQDSIVDSNVTIIIFVRRQLAMSR